MLYTYFKLVSCQLLIILPSPHTSKKQHEKPYPRWYAPSCCSTLSSHYSVPLVHPFRCTFILYPYTIDHPMKDTKKGHPVGCPQYDESNLSYVGIIQIRLWVKTFVYSQPVGSPKFSFSIRWYDSICKPKYQQFLSSPCRHRGIIFNHNDRCHLTIIAKWIID